MFCNVIKKVNDDIFFPEFKFGLSLENGTTQTIDFDKTIKVNKIPFILFLTFHIIKKYFYIKIIMMDVESHH